ncbi:fasciclin-like arabinogalactan protein 12 [Euphorbia lathyris]|uniref:fasciclin-like arabinogalactan protein 12 n=1 Tax=Euphorbia lathyris TaxID=212925 RepID=UPI003313B903
MQHSSLFSLPLLLLFLHFSPTISLSPTPSPLSAPPAKAPTPPPPHHHPHTSSPPPPLPTDVVGILLKAGKFITFIRLIKATRVDYQLSSQINSSTEGITVFAPSDAAFSNLKVDIGALNDKDEVSLTQYHILPRFLAKSDFQTLSNPIKTLAGSDDKYTMTITTTDNSVNISTGLTKSSISSIVYTDKQVAIYEIDKVLLPKRLFPPAAAPAALSAKPSADSPDGLPKSDEDDHDSSGAGVLDYHGVMFGVGMVIAAVLMIL